MANDQKIISDTIEFEKNSHSGNWITKNNFQDDIGTENLKENGTSAIPCGDRGVQIEIYSPEFLVAE